MENIPKFEICKEERSMRKLKVSFLVAACIMAVLPLRAEELTIKKGIILPFYDYSASGPAYRSTYLPELIRENLNLPEGMVFLDAHDIAPALK